MPVGDERNLEVRILGHRVERHTVDVSIVLQHEVVRRYPILGSRSRDMGDHTSNDRLAGILGWLGASRCCQYGGVLVERIAHSGTDDDIAAVDRDISLDERDALGRGRTVRTALALRHERGDRASLSTSCTDGCLSWGPCLPEGLLS